MLSRVVACGHQQFIGLVAAESSIAKILIGLIWCMIRYARNRKRVPITEEIRADGFGNYDFIHTWYTMMIEITQI